MLEVEGSREPLQALLAALGREFLSFMCGSRHFLGQWYVGYAVPSKRQWCDTSWPHSEGAKRGRATTAKRTTCFLLGPGGRETCHSQGEKTFFFSWLMLALPVPLSISVSGCPMLSHTTSCWCIISSFCTSKMTHSYTPAVCLKAACQLLSQKCPETHLHSHGPPAAS